MQKMNRKSKYYGILVLVPLMLCVVLASQAWAPVPPPPPPPGDEGCTPGYWKNHLEAWGPTGFSPYDDFDTIFGVDFFEPDKTLEDALWARGGGVNRLARHATAGLLSAAHPDVAYPLTVDEVLANFLDTNELEEANELGCPL